VLLVCGDGGDDVGTAHGFAGVGGALHAQLRRGLGEVGGQLVGGGRVDVVQAHFLDAQHVVEGQRLELALGAIADQRHDLGVLTGQLLRGHDRGRRGADGGGHGQLAEHGRHAGFDVGQGAERHHRRQAVSVVAGVAVYELEAVLPVVGKRQQPDHGVGGVGGGARSLVVVVPAGEVGLQGVRQARDHLRQAVGGNDPGNVVGGQRGGHVGLLCDASTPSGAG